MRQEKKGGNLRKSQVSIVLVRLAPTSRLALDGSGSSSGSRTSLVASQGGQSRPAARAARAARSAKRGESVPQQAGSDENRNFTNLATGRGRRRVGESGLLLRLNPGCSPGRAVRAGAEPGWASVEMSVERGCRRERGLLLETQTRKSQANPAGANKALSVSLCAPERGEQVGVLV